MTVPNILLGARDPNGPNAGVVNPDSLASVAPASQLIVLPNGGVVDVGNLQALAAKGKPAGSAGAFLRRYGLALGLLAVVLLWPSLTGRRGRR